MTEASARLDLGVSLYDQGRYDLAEREIRAYLATDPGSAVGHAVLALTLTERDQAKAGEAEARLAIASDPGHPFAHYSLARALLARSDHAGALQAAEETIQIDPDHPRGYSVLALARFGQRRWSDALAAADQGLALEPEHEGLLTIRGLALQQLGKSAAASEAFEGALRRDPSNAYAHASRGLTHLHAGRMDEALVAFQEGLRLDPNNEMARAGLVEALKARHSVYAWLLQGMLALGRLSGRAMLALFVGFFVVQRALRGLAAADPSLAPLVAVIIGAYLFIVWMTFAASPLFNLLLRLDALGRHALTQEQRTESAIVGPLVVVGIVGLILFVVTGGSAGSAMAIIGLGCVVPIASAFACDPGWPRWVMIGIAGAIALVGVAAIAQSVAGHDDVGLNLVFIAGFFVVVSTWLAAPLSRVNVRR